MYVYMYRYMCVYMYIWAYMCVYVYVYIYMQNRERASDKDWQTHKALKP